jgi:hypothetical protein
MGALLIADPYSNSDRNSYSYTYCYVYTDANTNFDSDGNGNIHAYSNSNSHSYCVSKPDAHSNCDLNRNATFSNTYFNANASSYTNSKTCRDTAASPYSGAAPVRMLISDR